MSRVIRFEAVARSEFVEAVAWYERQQPGLGREFDQEVNEVLRRVSLHPEQFRSVTARVRKARLRRFAAYSIYFSEAANTIGVIAVFNGRRNPAVLRRRLVR